MKVGLLWSSYLNTEVLLGFTIFISWSLSVAVLGSFLTSQLFICLHFMFLKGLAIEYSTDNLVARTLVFQLITSGDFLGYFTWCKVSVQCNLQLTIRTEICIQTPPWHMIESWSVCVFVLNSCFVSRLITSCPSWPFFVLHLNENSWLRASLFGFLESI